MAHDVCACHCAVLAHCAEVQADLRPHFARGRVVLHIDLSHSADYYTLAFISFSEIQKLSAHRLLSGQKQ